MCKVVGSTLSEIPKIFSTQVMLNIDIYVQLLIVADCSLYRDIRMYIFRSSWQHKNKLKVNRISFFLLLRKKKKLRKIPTIRSV